MNQQNKFYLIIVVAFFTFLIIILLGLYMETFQVRQFILQRELPTVGLAVATKLDNAASQYKEIGEELLQGNVLRNWILSGEKDPEREGKLPGAIGAGIEADRFYKIIQAFEDIQDVTLRLVRLDGRIIYSSAPVRTIPLASATLDLLIRNRDNPVGSILHQTPGDHSLQWGVFLANWNSFLIVEKPEHSVRTASKTFLILGGLALILLIITLFAVRYVSIRLREPFREMAHRIVQQKTILYYFEHFLQTVDQEKKLEQEIRVLHHWLEGTPPKKRHYTGIKEFLDPLFLELSLLAEKKYLTISWWLEQAPLQITFSAAVAVRIVVRDLFERILNVLSPHVTIPTVGSIVSSGYRIDIATGARKTCIDGEWFEAAVELLLTHEITLTVDSTNDGTLLVALFIRRE